MKNKSQHPLPLPSIVKYGIVIGLFVAALGVGILAFCSTSWMTYFVSANWQEVEATILDVSFESHVSHDPDGPSITYSVKCRYEYSFNGINYQSDRVVPYGGSSNDYGMYKKRYRRLKKAKDQGQTVTALVNPARPSEALLVRTIGIGMTIIGFFGLGCVGFGLVGIPSNVLAILRQRQIRSMAQDYVNSNAEHPFRSLMKDSRRYCPFKTWKSVETDALNGSFELRVSGISSLGTCLGAVPLLVLCPAAFAYVIWTLTPNSMGIRLWLVVPAVGITILMAVCTFVLPLVFAAADRKKYAAYAALDNLQGAVDVFYEQKQYNFSEVRCVQLVQGTETETVGKGKTSTKTVTELNLILANREGEDFRVGLVGATTPWDIRKAGIQIARILNVSIDCVALS